jgi:hypothetical protein
MATLKQIYDHGGIQDCHRYIAMNIGTSGTKVVRMKKQCNMFQANSLIDQYINTNDPWVTEDFPDPYKRAKDAFLFEEHKDFVHPLILTRAGSLIEITKKDPARQTLNLLQATTLAKNELEEELGYKLHKVGAGEYKFLNAYIKWIGDEELLLDQALNILENNKEDLDKDGNLKPPKSSIEEELNQEPQINIQPESVVDNEFSETESPESFDEFEYIEEPEPEEKLLLGMPQNQAYILLAIVGLVIFYFITKPKK